MKKSARKSAIFISRGRLAFVVTVLACVFCAVLARLYYLHIERSDRSVEAVDKARKLFDKIAARRGDIVDAKGNLLATSRPVITLGVDPERVPQDAKTDEKIRHIADILGMEYAALKSLCTPYQDSEKIAAVKAKLTPDQTKALKKYGLFFQMEYDELIRKCVTTPKNDLKVDNRVDQVKNNPRTFGEISKILGIPQAEVERNFCSHSPRWKKITDSLDDASYALIMSNGKKSASESGEGDALEMSKAEGKNQLPDNRVKGIYGEKQYVRVYPSGALTSHVVGYLNKELSPELGVERQFNYYLHGQDGWIETERDARRQELAHFRSRDVQPTDGMSVELSIDLIMQEMAQREIKNIVGKYNPKSATVIISDPATGYILAMSSYPNFDPNDIGGSDRDSLRNRAISDQYEPGSTFKIVSISAALNESLVGPDDTFDCNSPTVSYKGRLLRLPKEAHTMDTLSVREITKKSSNRGAAQLGVLLGEKKLYEYAHLYGFGDKTDIGLVGEIGGTLHQVKDWDGLTITRLPMGHAVAATPLQVHCAMSVVANGGIYMQPKLVKRVYDKDGNTVVSYPPKAVRRVITPKIATLMSEMLTEVVSNTGTAARAQLDGFKVAGKTGTSQKIINGTYSNKDHIASFSGFFPAQRPRLVITVVVDSPQLKGVGYGGVVAAPSFKNIAEQAANYLGIQSDADYEKMVAWK